MAYSPRWNIFDRIFDSDTRVRVIDDALNSRALIEVDGATIATFNGDGLTLASGASINEFSTDGTLAGNSDDAVPTEQAVKTYVDNQFVSLSSDRITQDDSKVQVVDDGTNTAYVEVVIDSATVGTWTSDGLTLASGTSINEFSTDGTLSGDSDDAIPTEAAVKTYVDTEIASISTDAISEGDSYVEVVDPGEGYVTTVIDGSEVIHTDAGSTVFSHDVSISGDLFVDGTTFVVHNQEVTTSDNIIVVNQGETGPGVTAGIAGIEIDRGSETNYRFVFAEDTDTFRIGEIGDTQAVATREDSPTNLRVPWWNDTAKRFDTAGEAYITIDNVLDEVTVASGNSYLRVGDDGTHTGYVEIVTDGVQVAYFDPEASTQRIGKSAGAGRIEVADAQVSVSIAAITAMTLTGTGVSLRYGTSVNEFSTDGTLAGNSDDAVPTEQAVKTYVDNATGGLSLDKIYEGDSYVEVIDDGTNAGYVTVVTDGVEVTRFDSEASSVRVGKSGSYGQLAVTDTSTFLAIGDPTSLITPPQAYAGVTTGGGVNSFIAGMPMASIGFQVTDSYYGGDPAIYAEIGSENEVLNLQETEQILGVSGSATVTLEESGSPSITSATGDLEVYLYGGSPNRFEVSIDTDEYITITTSDNYFGYDGNGNYLYISTGDGENPPETSIYCYDEHVFEASFSGYTYVRSDNSNYFLVYYGGGEDPPIATITINDTDVFYSEANNETYITSPDEYSEVNLRESGAGDDIRMRIGGTTEATFDSDGLSLKNGTSVNEFSTDITLGDDSDNAIPTEHAVKTYVDNSLGGVAVDKIYEADSKVEVVDLGVGYITSVVDGVEIGRWDSYQQRTGNEDQSYILVDQTANTIIVSEGQADVATFTEDGLTLENGTNVNEFSTDGTLSGNSDDAVPTEKAVKTYVDNNVSLTDKIYEGDSYVEVVDDGTASGYVTIVTDGVEVAHFDPDAATQRIGKESAAGRVEVSDSAVYSYVGAQLRLQLDGTASKLIADGNNYVEIFPSGGEGSQAYWVVDGNQVVALTGTTQRLGQASGAGRIDISTTEVTANIGTDEVLDLTSTNQRFGVDGDTFLNLNQSGDYAYLRVANNNILNANVNYTSLSSVDNGNRFQLYSDGEGSYILGFANTSEVFRLEETLQRLGQASGNGRITVTDTDISAYVNTRPILDADEDRINLGDSSEAYVTVDQTANTITVTESSVVAATFTEFGVTLTSGATVNEFSTDGTLAGNSDSAVPTEKAVKTYVDSSINVIRDVRFVSSDTTAADGEILLVDTTAGDVNIELFEGSDAQITIKKITSDSNSVIVSTTPGTIDGNASKSIDAYNAAYTFVSDGTDFYII